MIFQPEINSLSPGHRAVVAPVGNLAEGIPEVCLQQHILVPVPPYLSLEPLSDGHIRQSEFLPIGPRIVIPGFLCEEPLYIRPCDVPGLPAAAEPFCPALNLHPVGHEEGISLCPLEEQFYLLVQRIPVQKEHIIRLLRQFPEGLRIIQGHALRQCIDFPPVFLPQLQDTYLIQRCP